MPGQTRRLHLVVNAGGQSRRMGRNKAWLPVPPSGAPLLWHVVERLRNLHVRQTVIVVSQSGSIPPFPPSQPITIVHDAFPGTGALGGVATGLRACDGWAALVACDMPLVSAQAFGPLLAIADEQTVEGADRWDAVVPLVDGVLQPFHALYHPRCLPAIERCLMKGEYQLRSFLDQVRARIVSGDELGLGDHELRSFVNVNTPDEWDAALVLLCSEVVRGGAGDQNDAEP